MVYKYKVKKWFDYFYKTFHYLRLCLTAITPFLPKQLHSISNCSMLVASMAGRDQLVLFFEIMPQRFSSYLVHMFLFWVYHKRNCFGISLFLWDLLELLISKGWLTLCKRKMSPWHKYYQRAFRCICVLFQVVFFWSCILPLKVKYCEYYLKNMFSIKVGTFK
jgi:hypothetical protein